MNEQFETHFTNIAESLEKLMKDHDKFDHELLIFSLSFLVTENFLHLGLNEDHVFEKIMEGVNFAINDYKKCREQGI